LEGYALGVTPGRPSVREPLRIFLELGRDVSTGDDMRAAIRRYGAALELVDLGPPDSADVATNIFHRAVALRAGTTGAPAR
jgi:hypothetical protein